MNSRRLGQYYGLVIDDPENPLTNLRFADDVLLLACCRRDVSRMVTDLDEEARKYGLKVHLGKTVILTNVLPRPMSIQCSGQNIRVLQEGEAEKYLGRKFSLDDYHNVELSHRIAAGWAAFRSLKHVLCDRRLCLRARMKLLQTCVAPSMLYAAETWTLTVVQASRIRATQRKMLRQMVAMRRGSNETWVEYIQRSTHASVDLAARHGVPDWMMLVRRRRESQNVKLHDTRDDRWSFKLRDWAPWHRVHAVRSVGAQRKKWSEI